VQGAGGPDLPRRRAEGLHSMAINGEAAVGAQNTGERAENR
jgi:hypothetical protein